MDTNKCNDPTDSQDEKILDALLELRYKIERKYRGLRKHGRKWAPSHIMSLYYDIEKQIEIWYKYN